jgi:hypothetical protein
MLPPFKHLTSFQMVSMLALLSVSTASSLTSSLAALERTPPQQPSTQRKYIIRPPVDAGAMLSVVARSTRQIPIQVTDENDHPIPDLPVLFSLASTTFGTIASAGTAPSKLLPVTYTPAKAREEQEQTALSAGAAVPAKLRRLTDANGKASVRFIAGGTMGAVILTASIEGTDISWSGDIIILDDEKMPDQPIGSLTVKGRVYLNSNEARTGATIFVGNTIRAGPNSQAIINLDALGRITLQPDVTVQLIAWSSEKLIARCHCPTTTYIQVAQGNVEVVAPTNQPPTAAIMGAGRGEKVEGYADIVLSRGAQVILSCTEKGYAAGRSFWLKKGGLLTVLGIAAIIPVVVWASGRSDEQTSRPLSQSQP